MASFGIQLKVHEETWRAVEQQLQRLEMMSRDRANVLARGLKAGGNIVKRRTYERLPKPGYPGDKHELPGGQGPLKKALRDTLTVKVNQYSNGVFLLMVGYAYPAGAHGHLREAGHRMVVGGKLKRLAKTPRKQTTTLRQGRVVGTVAGRWDLMESGQQAESELNSQIEAAVLEAIDEAWRG